jgi:hypothetical protein
VHSRQRPLAYLADTTRRANRINDPSFWHGKFFSR